MKKKKQNKKMFRAKLKKMSFISVVFLFILTKKKTKINEKNLRIKRIGMLNSAQIYSGKINLFFRCIRFPFFLELNFVPTITQKKFQIRINSAKHWIKRNKKINFFLYRFSAKFIPSAGTSPGFSVKNKTSNVKKHFLRKN